MIEKSTTHKVLKFFLDYPNREFHLRELSRLTGLSMPTIVGETDQLAKKEIIHKKKSKILTVMMANRESLYFTRYKRIWNLQELYKSGLIDYLVKHYSTPPLLVLFGSYSRGEDIESSDVDLAIIGRNQKDANITLFEKKLKRSITLHFIDLTKISKEFKSNLYNGIVLEGSW